MAIQSINTLQNSDNYNNIAKEYILQSLANLGQRYNVKGDSISIDSLSFDKLFNLTDVDVDNSLIIVEKDRETEDYLIYLVGKNDQNSWDLSRNILPNATLSTKDESLTIESFVLDSNPALQYSAAEFINNKINDSIYYDFYCRQDNNVNINVNYISERFDKNSDRLISGIRIFKKHFSQSFVNNYILVSVKLNSDNDYDVKLYVSKESIDNINESDLYDFVKEYDYVSDSYLTSMFNLVYTVTCDYDNYKIIASSELLSQFATSDQDILQNQILYSFTDDINNLYHYLKEEYSVSNYGKIEGIYVKLLQELYNEIKIDDDSDNKIYIPLKDKEGNFYSITYTYNTNKPEIVYFAGKDIEVRFIENDITDSWMDINYEDYKGTIISHTEKFERVSFYYFETQLYNNEFITDLNVNKISTLPYIDKNGYWVINDISTGIYARGRSAGNPNIIIVETTNKEGGYNIITGAKKSELLEQLVWTSKVAKVEPLERINLDNLSFKNEFDYFSVVCSIPDIERIPEVNKLDYLAQLENSIIICVSPISCINYDENDNTDNINYSYDDVVEIYGEYGIITTIWTLNDENEFDYLRKRNNDYAAADFNYLSNINNLIQYAVKNAEQLHPDNYEFTRLIFDSINTSLKNNTSENISYIYPNLSNKLSGQYNISNYNNDINFTFKANNVIGKQNNRNVDYLTQSSDVKYYNPSFNIDELNSANVVTNSLYTYNVNGVQMRYNEYIPNYNVPSFDLSEVLTRNETLLNRLNILSFNKEGNSYLSYIGTSIDTDKNILTIGTTDTNINMGTDTLISEADKSSFNKQNKIEVNFDNVKLAGETTINKNLNVDEDIYLNGNVWTKDFLSVETKTRYTDVTYYTSIVTPASRYIFEVDEYFNNISDNVGRVEVLPTIYADLDSSYTNLSYLQSYALYEWCVDRNKLYTITTIPEYYTNSTKHNIYFSDGIYVPVLLSQIGLSKYVKNNDNSIKLDNVVITSNMELITVDNNPLLLLSSSTNLYPDKYNYSRTNNGNNLFVDNINSNFTYTIFTANPLKITYFENNGKLFIHLEELYSKNKFTTNFKLKQNYIL